MQVDSNLGLVTALEDFVPLTARAVVGIDIYLVQVRELIEVLLLHRRNVIMPGGNRTACDTGILPSLSEDGLFAFQLSVQAD